LVDRCRAAVCLCLFRLAWPLPARGSRDPADLELLSGLAEQERRIWRLVAAVPVCAVPVVRAETGCLIFFADPDGARRCRLLSDPFRLDRTGWSARTCAAFFLR